MKKIKNSTLISNLLAKNLAKKKLRMKPSAYESCESNSTHLKEWLADKHIDEISIEFWEDFFSHLRNRYSGSKTSQYKTVLNAVYKEAMLESLVPENLVENIYVGERPVGDKKVYSEQEIEQLLSSVVGFQFEKALIQLAISTGLNLCELMAITECDYDFANKKLLISKRLTWSSKFSHPS